ncbi:hypothetical protein KMZ32_05975 [Phycicoccus sp. MAQZ13P-2]|uniref:hypothetical protein n=1 Tax=Phycicoccus mangrovi TaxID=2840470 RepID=UPI001C0034DC|nr:hypothetical protein [Phycicoccus mangrovi]MBT9273621.1 hypothetical protein [Phycicoccus mangrovi]
MTNENDRWTTRDRPVLMAVAMRLDEGKSISSETVAEELNISPSDAARAMIALLDVYIQGSELRGLGPSTVIASGLTERGRRVAGLWPAGEGVDALVNALRQAEEATDDPEEKGAIRRATGAVLGVGKDVMTDVVAAVIAKQMGA